MIIIDPHIRLAICAVALVFVVALVEVLRRRYLRPEYALVWGMMSALLFLLAAFPRLLGAVVWLTGMNYQSSVIFLAFIMIAAMFMNFSLINCRHGRRIVRLTQEVTLLTTRLRELEEANGSVLEQDAG